MTIKYPAPSRPFIRARNHGGRQTPRAIVMHGTVSSDNVGTARNIAEWWAGPTSPMSSAHYVVDPREDIQCVGDHNVAYHCGYNTGSIGVELCDEQQGPASRWQDRDSKRILARAARLVAQLCLAYDIEPRRPSIADLKRKGPHGIYGHNDSRLAFGNTTHTDPRDFPWKHFLHLVRQQIAVIKGAAVPEQPPGPKPGKGADPLLVGTANIKFSLSREKAERILKKQVADTHATVLNEWNGHVREAILAEQGRLLRPVTTNLGLPVARRSKTGWVWAQASGVAVGMDAERFDVYRARRVELHSQRRVAARFGRRTSLSHRYAVVLYGRDRTNGEKVALVGFHLPAGVQARGGGYVTIDPTRVDAHLDARHRLEELGANLRKRGFRVFEAGDTNFNNLQLKGMTSCWGKDGPGTHHNRTIDAVFAFEEANTEPQDIDNLSDHDRVVAEY